MTGSIRNEVSHIKCIRYTFDGGFVFGGFGKGLIFSHVFGMVNYYIIWYVGRLEN